MPPCRHQDPDDLYSRPALFTRLLNDHDAERTYAVRDAWHLVIVMKLGELIVRETVDGPMVKILMEPK